ncbi:MULTISPECIES: hypothetical protein [unclassified Streptomyces]|uniref:hypothetical protein n=1 Tax=unclassified Streptomyces TaxID=2593676 RepID=UPI003D742091
MPSTDLSPVTLLEAATDLARRRAARLGTEPAPARPVTVVLDEAAALVADPASPARDLLTELMASGRAVGVRVQLRSRLHRQYATLAELNAAVESGER